MTEILFARQDEIDAIADQFAPISGLAALSSVGIITRAGPNLWVTRTITGTDGEINIINGNAVSGEPEVHLATELVFTGKTIDGGTYTSPTITGPTLTGGTYTGGTFTGGTVSAQLIVSSLGTKAVTLASFAGRVVDVNDFTGVVNDGSADTYSAVAAAYAAACNGMVPGGVLFSKGTYLFAQQTPTGAITNPTITIKSKCHTFFEGARILSQNGPAGGWGYRDAIFINETNATDISFSGSAEFQVANKGVLLTGGTTSGSKFVTVSSVSDLKVGMGLAGTNIVEPSIINEINGSGCTHPCVKINNNATGTCPSGIAMKAGWSGGPFISIVDASRLYIGGDLTFLDQEGWTNQIWFSNHIVLGRLTDYIIDGIKGAYVLKTTTEGSDYGGEGLIYLAGGVQHGLITNVEGTSGDDCIAMDLNSTMTGTPGFDLDISFNVINNVSCKSLWAQVIRATVEPTTSVGEIKNNHFNNITGTADAYAGSINGSPQLAQGIIVEDISGRGTIANHDNTFTNITLDCTHALNPCINVQVAKNITFANTDTQNPGANHIYLAHCVDCILINPRANTTNGSGFNSIEADSNTSGLHIIGGLVTSSNGANAVYIKGPNASVTGMFIHDNAGYGLVLDGATYGYVGGNTFSTNGGGLSVVEINAADHNQITDNILHGQGVSLVGANSFSFDTTSAATSRAALAYSGSSPITVNNATGVISCASCITAGSPIEVLSSSRIIYVNPHTSSTSPCGGFTCQAGNDTTGTGTIAAPFATLQGAWNKIANTINRNGYAITIQLADGTDTTGLAVYGPWNGGGFFNLTGNCTTPANTIISTTTANGIQITGAQMTVSCMKVQTGGAAGDGLVSYGAGSELILGPSLIFGATIGSHMAAYTNGTIYAPNGLTNAYTITGGGSSHIHAFGDGVINMAVVAVTLTGTPAFASYFAGVAGAQIDLAGVTYSGAATGIQALVHDGGRLDTGGTTLPGDGGVLFDTWGQYNTIFAGNTPLAFIGSSSGNTTLQAQAAASGAMTIPSGTSTLAALGINQSWDGINVYSATSLIQMTSGAAVAANDFNDASNALHVIHRISGGTQFGNGKLTITDTGPIQFVTGYGTGTLISDASGNITSNTTTGTGDSVKATSATLITPTLGAATATSINKITITAPATSATLTLVNGSSLITAGANALTLTSTGTTNSTLPSGTHTLAGLDVTQTWSGGNTFTAAGGVIIKSATQSALGLASSTGGTTGWVVGRSLASTDLNDFFIYDNTLGARRVGIAATTGIITFDAYGAGTLISNSSGVITSNTTTGTGNSVNATGPTISGATLSGTTTLPGSGQITTGGLISIGKASFNKALEIYQASNTAFRIQNANTGTGGMDGFLFEMNDSLAVHVVNYENGVIDFYTNGTFAGQFNTSGGLSIGLTTDGGAGTVYANRFTQTNGFTVAGLPTCNAAAKGARTYVTDAVLPTFMAIIAGGGSTVAPTFCNGTNWVAN